MTSFKILKYGNYQIQLVENYPCKNSKELHAREKYYIKKTNCIDKNPLIVNFDDIWTLFLFYVRLL
jgi:hypothetical protein